MMEKIKHIFRIPTVLLVPYSLRRNSRKLEKQAKKNRKAQDPNLFPYEDRYQRMRKVVTKTLKRLGVKVVVVGEENIPNGGM